MHGSIWIDKHEDQVPTLVFFVQADHDFVSGHENGIAGAEASFYFEKAAVFVFIGGGDVPTTVVFGDVFRGESPVRARVS